MENSHLGHNSGSMHNGQWPQVPQHPNVAWNPLQASLPRAGYVNSNYHASLQSAYGQGSLSIFSQQPRSVSIPYNQFSSAHPHPGSIPQPTPVRSFRHGPGGPHRCTHPGCPWSGPTPKALEIHKMDRHLIFPLGWKPRKGLPDGEGGPNTPVPGTGITLNTPEAIDAWIAERKKKFPSAARVEEKVRNRAEAIERGELVPENSRKRKRNDEYMDYQRHSSRGWGTTYDPARGSFPRGYERARGRGRGRGSESGRGRGRGRSIIAQSLSIPIPTLTPGPRSAEPPSRPLVEHDSSSASDEESSNSDMDPIKDAVSSKPPVSEGVQLVAHDSDATVEDLDIQKKPEAPRPALQPAPRPRKAPRQPRVIQHPFAQRPPLLKQLLLPEVRHTVSNLSQAIRFLVDNDFLENVELKPGEADNPLIEEVGAAADSAKPSTPSSARAL